MEAAVSEGGKRSGNWRGAVARSLAPIALTGLLLAALAGLGALMIWQNYTAALEAGEARAKSAAQVMAAHIEWMIEASDQALRRIDDTLGEEPIRWSLDAIRDISEAVRDLPSGFQYSVYDEAGRLRMSSLPEAIGVNVEDREYFRQLRDGAQVVISPQLEERSSGRPVFVIARRIARGDVFHGAASIAIPASTMATFWSSMELGPRSTVSLVRQDGWLVARYPLLDAAIDLSASPVFTTYLPLAPSGFYHSAVSPADGFSRIVGYWRVGGWPLVAMAGIERGEALALFRSNLRSGLTLGLPLMAILVLGSVWIAYLLRADAIRRAALEQALERNRFLLREIHHRVKNNLQAVSSLIRLQPLPEEAREDMRRRIAAMIAVHEQIYKSDQFERVDVAPYVARLVKEIAAGYEEPVEIDTRLDSLDVARDQALPLGLIVNEAVSNAFKHAFAQRRDGRLRVELTRAGDGKGRLVVADDGPGYTPRQESKGMGSRLIAGFVAQLGGSVEIDGSRGTVVSVSFPLG